MISIAIDGPGGAGKSTIARTAAKQLGYIYVDTGALYRAIGLFALRSGVVPSDRENVLPLLNRICLDLVFQNHEQRVLLCEEDVSLAIREPEVSMAASDVSAIPEVRDYLFDLQRSFAAKNNVIMDGRDIGTVVLPNADLKIFLTASEEERARRRFVELKQKGATDTFEEVLADLKQRDYNDSHRAVAPLRQADDAVLVDTTGNTLEQSIDLVISMIKELKQ